MKKFAIAILIAMTMCLAIVVSILIEKRLPLTNFTSHNNTRHFEASNGLSGRYHIYPAIHAKGVLLWLHGDGAYEFKHPNSKRYLGGELGIKEIARQHNLTLIVPKTPSKDETWWTNGVPNSIYLTELINSIPNHQHLWICGFSGGSEITTYWLLEKLPNMNVKSGGAIIFSGGGSPKIKGVTHTLPKDKYVKQSYPLTWLVGEYDDGTTSSDNFNALKLSKQGYDFYRQQGWDAKRYIIPRFHHVLTKNNRGVYGQLLQNHLN
jgi:hypothetical protein